MEPENIMTLTTESALRKDVANKAVPKMQHRHFAFIAGIIRETMEDAACYRNDERKRGAEVALGVVAADFASALRDSNPNFDTDRFLTACGVE